MGVGISVDLKRPLLCLIYLPFAVRALAFKTYKVNAGQRRIKSPGNLTLDSKR